MRTLRLSLAGTVMLALLGGIGGVVVAQAEGAVYVSGTMWCIDEPRTIQMDDGVELHLFPLRCTTTMSDPRLSGTGLMDMQQFCLQEPGGHVCLGEGPLEITGPDGSWVGTYGWVQAPSRSVIPAWGVLEGTASYEGWTFWFHVPDLMDTSALTAGILYEGPPPPWGTTLPLTPAEVITDPIMVVVAMKDAVAGYIVIPTRRVVSATEVGPDVFIDPAEVKGRKAAVDIPAGTPITPDLLEPPPDE